MERFHGVNQLFYFPKEGKAYKLTFTHDGIKPEVVSLTEEEKAKEFRFGTMFNDQKFPRFDLNVQGLIKLGNEMIDRGNSGDSDIPSGYTYLGQFIDHDLSFILNFEHLPTGMISASQIKNARSPLLDLDSLYGFGPLCKESEDLYQPDKLRFKVGQTSSAIIKPLPNDLRRKDNSREALIADKRNDENLILAQTHLAFIKFHNAVVDKLELTGKFLGTQLFEKAKETVIRHYQWIILNDFLPRIIKKEVLDDCINTWDKYFPLKANEEPYMPVEFSFAAYRLGHSMVRGEYNLNRIHEDEEDKKAATLSDLFQQTGRGFIGEKATLPTDWVIDWTRFYDFKGIKDKNSKDIQNNPKSNKARLIDTKIAAGLHTLIGMPNNAMSLPVRNLIRGNFLAELPLGQDIANAWKQHVKPLTPDEILKDNPHSQILKDNDFHNRTPLWYYILREAEIQGDGGKRLGDIGSRIVASTFVALIHRSNVSILGDDWTPTKEGKEMTLGTRGNKFEMGDLLAFVDDLNPLK